MAYTKKGLATRQRIVDATAARVREHGVAATTLDDVRASTNTSKSQLFHYFPGGKAELLQAVAREEADRVLADQQPYLDDLTSWSAWRAWRDAVVTRYQEQGRECPLSTLLSELGRADPVTEAIVTELLEAWLARISAGIRAMQHQGEVRTSLDADRTAAAILAGIQGGVSMMLSIGRLDPLEAALDLGLAHLQGG
jgi:AcrR family transcriptional regulator